MKAQRISIVGLVVLGLAVQSVVSAPNPSSDSINSDYSSSTHDTTRIQTDPVENCGEGRQDRFSTMPPEILKQMIRPMLTDEYISELMKTSNFLHNFVYNHLNKEYIMWQYVTILSKFDRITNDTLVDEEKSWLSSTWQQLLHQHLYGELFFKVGGYPLCPPRPLYDKAQLAISREKPVSENHQRYLEQNQNEPSFQPNAWWFVDPELLQTDTLATQIPLLALVDLADGHKIAEAIGVLTNGDTLHSVEKGMQDPARARISHLMMKNLDAGTSNTILPALSSNLDRTLSAIAIARLAVTNRFDDMETFMTAKSPPPTMNDEEAIRSFYNLNRLAIVLASMFQQESALNVFTRVYKVEASEDEIESNNQFLCNLAGNMNDFGLFDGAVFLKSYWACDGEANKFEAVESEADTFENGSSRSHIIDAVDELYFYMPKQLTLTNDKRMGVMVLISDFEPSEKARVSDLGPWAFHKEEMHILSSVVDPVILINLQSSQKTASVD
ncbi:hypothetical protein BJ085DRAFT_34883 [Dimargaris cristalligena]|uniref:F-box domain-containing protein n=1 Tax=Dimargaris cristalligena TaxID=215637 RepID=A0A4P9ZMP8_9FUNG|nr:hypothetical protein BJ085DRAFT_34883 [Dimargaris cristalligena]|eukprot:RKP34676.1 hypothetical protein BJ085DRAFT_34883 [Dimargaris cristalligena]